MSTVHFQLLTFKFWCFFVLNKRNDPSFCKKLPNPFIYCHVSTGFVAYLKSYWLLYKIVPHINMTSPWLPVFKENTRGLQMDKLQNTNGFKSQVCKAALWQRLLLKSTLQINWMKLNGTLKPKDKSVTLVSMRRCCSLLITNRYLLYYSCKNKSYGTK